MEENLKVACGLVSVFCLFVWLLAVLLKVGMHDHSSVPPMIPRDGPPLRLASLNQKKTPPFVLAEMSSQQA